MSNDESNPQQHANDEIRKRAAIGPILLVVIACVLGPMLLRSVGMAIMSLFNG